jgi:hypothetical protein
MNSAVRQSLPILSLVNAGVLFKQVGFLRSSDSQVMARLIINIGFFLYLWILAGMLILPGLLSIF